MSPTTLEAHLSKSWGMPKANLRWPYGPIEKACPNFRVLLFERSRKTLAFATDGLASVGSLPKLELFVVLERSRSQDVGDAIVENLAALAFHHLQGDRLNLGHSVDFGRPFVPGSICTCGLISLPYLDGPSVEWSENRELRVLWLIPITAAERAMKTAHGLEALEQAFDANAVDLLDPLRSSVVPC